MEITLVLTSTLVIIFSIYILVDMLIFLIHKIAAENYWKEKGENAIYSYLPLTNIPMALYCYLKFGNLLATWKLIETEVNKQNESG